MRRVFSTEGGSSGIADEVEERKVEHLQISMYPAGSDDDSPDPTG
jgi:hypothetical protein